MENFNWEGLVFSDEVRFGFHHDGRILIWRGKGQRHNPSCVDLKVKSRQSLMFWGCVTYNGTGPLFECSNNMNSQKYFQILYFANIATLSDFGLLFQQDNAPIHKSQITTSWLIDKDVECIQWPPNSPDLNIIENIWSHIKRRLARQSTHNLSDLRTAVFSEWSQISIKLVQNLYDSIPKRIKECKRKRGHI